MRVLITGASGFVGAHLGSYFNEIGQSWWGLDRVIPASFQNTSNFWEADLGDAVGLLEMIRKIRPTHVFHLAGLLGSASYEALYQANVIGTANLLEAIRAADASTWVLISSSSGVYGATKPEQNPLTEDCSTLPVSHYGASKLAQETVGQQYYHAYGLPVIIARAFNLVGPGLSQVLLASSLARQIAAVESGRTNGPIRVGNLWPRRDYVDVRDLVKAYVALMTAGQPGWAYNVCRGRSYSVQECVDILLGLARQPVTVEQHPDHVRREEIADQVGNPGRLYQATGWQAVISLEQSLTDLLDYWRAYEKRRD